MYLFVHIQGSLYYFFAQLDKVWVPPVDYIYGSTYLYKDTIAK